MFRARISHLRGRSRCAAALCISLAAGALLSVLSCSSCSSRDQQESISHAQLEADILTLMERWQIPGISAGVIVDGEIFWSRGLGVTNIQTGEPADDRTIFHAASMSKPVFAYAVLKMCDEGLLALDTPLVEYAPREYIEERFLGHSMEMEGFRSEWFSRITARMALSHSSGLQHFGLKKPAEILFEPGTAFHYSSNGIEYLRYIAEYVTGSSLDEIMARYVLEPLQMEESSYLWREEYASNSAAGHDKYGETSGSIYRYPLPTAQAGLYTNARDYARFLIALLNGEGLKKETYDEMLTPQVRTNPGVHWGLGLGLEISSHGKGIWHWGDAGTHTGYFYADPDRKTGFVYFANSFYGLAILEDLFTLVDARDHPALSFTVGTWSFRDDYLSPSMEFQNKYFTGRTDEALDFYRWVAGEHERGLRFVDEVVLQYWAAGLVQKGKMADAVRMLRLLIDAYHPEESDECGALAQKYLDTKTNETAADFLIAVKSKVNGIPFHWTDMQFEPVMEMAIAELRPFEIGEEALRSCTGDYDAFSLLYEDGSLLFSSERAGEIKMIPIEEDTFLLKGVADLRIRMVREGEAVVAAEIVRSDGEPRVFQRAP